MKLLDSVPVVAVIAALALTGCQSVEKGEKPFAAVEIRGNTPGQVKTVAAEVFRSHGYTVTESGKNKLLCDKPASGWTELAYGGWGDTSLFIRVAVSIIAVPGETCRLEAQAYRLEDRGTAAEHAIPLTRMHSGAYQKLLDDVARRFKSQAQSGS